MKWALCVRAALVNRCPPPLTLAADKSRARGDCTRLCVGGSLQMSGRPMHTVSSARGLTLSVRARRVAHVCVCTSTCTQRRHSQASSFLGRPVCPCAPSLLLLVCSVRGVHMRARTRSKLHTLLAKIDRRMLQSAPLSFSFCHRSNLACRRRRRLHLAGCILIVSRYSHVSTMECLYYKQMSGVGRFSHAPSLRFL